MSGATLHINVQSLAVTTEVAKTLGSIHQVDLAARIWLTTLRSQEGRYLTLCLAKSLCRLIGR